MTREKLIKTIIDMWKANKSGGEISKAVGLTRSAVMGHIYRLNLKGETSKKNIQRNITLAPKPIKIKKSKPPKINRNTKRGRPRKPEPPPPRSLTILQLRETSCRYILDTPNCEGVFFCGLPKERGSYCENHAKLCYIPPIIKSRPNGNNYSIKSNSAPRYPQG